QPETKSGAAAPLPEGEETAPTTRKRAAAPAANMTSVAEAAVAVHGGVDTKHRGRLRRKSREQDHSSSTTPPAAKLATAKGRSRTTTLPPPSHAAGGSAEGDGTGRGGATTAPKRGSSQGTNDGGRISAKRK
ncbi:unnamed protein product, partial [Ectocarpus sp. 12 AP-2014]